MKQFTLQLLTRFGCAPCKEVEEHLHALGLEFPSVTIEIIEVGTPQSLTLMDSHTIKELPAIIVDNVFWRSGYQSKNDLRNLFKVLLEK